MSHEVAILSRNSHASFTLIGDERFRTFEWRSSGSPRWSESWRATAKVLRDRYFPVGLNAGTQIRSSFPSSLSSLPRYNPLRIERHGHDQFGRYYSVPAACYETPSQFEPPTSTELHFQVLRSVTFRWNISIPRPTSRLSTLLPAGF